MARSVPEVATAPEQPVTVNLTRPDELHLIPYGDMPNVYIDAIDLMRGTEHIYGLREGQTPEEFWDELEAAKVREEYGLPPGRTMPTDEEIAASIPPVTKPAPAPPDRSASDAERYG